MVKRPRITAERNIAMALDMRGDFAVRCADADYESTIIGMS